MTYITTKTSDSLKMNKERENRDAGARGKKDGLIGGGYTSLSGHYDYTDEVDGRGI